MDQKIAFCLTTGRVVCIIKFARPKGRRENGTGWKFQIGRGRDVEDPAIRGKRRRKRLRMFSFRGQQAIGVGKHFIGGSIL
jgi:hypothetical protein